MASDGEDEVLASLILEAAPPLLELLRGLPDGVVLHDEDVFTDLPEEVQALMLAMADAVANTAVMSAAEKDCVMSVQEAFGLAVRDQVNHCKAAAPNGQGCSTVPRAAQLKNLGVCSTHKYWQIFSEWATPGKFLVDVTCCNCLGGEQAEADSLPCVGCGKGVHPECLTAWVGTLDPPNWPEDLRVGDVEFWVCNSCLATDWPRVSLTASFLRREDSARRFLLMPHESMETGREVLGKNAYEKAVEQAEAGQLAQGFFALKAKERARPRPLQSFSRPLRRPAGGGRISLSSKSKERSAEQVSREFTGQREQEVASSEVEGAAPESSMQAEIRRAVQQAMREQAGRGVGRPALPGANFGLLANMEALIDGSQWGAKSGHEGAMNDPNSAMREVYTGQGSSVNKTWGRVVEHHIGQRSVSERVNGLMPGTNARQQAFQLSEEGFLVVADSGSLAVPSQAVWIRWMSTRSRTWKAAPKSGIDVFDPSHPQFEFFSTMAKVIVMRYRWLRAVAADMQQGFDAHPWSVVWRYLVLTVQRDFASQPGFTSRLDRQLLEILEEDAFDQDQSLAILVPYDYYRMQLAEREAGVQSGINGGAGQLAGGALGSGVASRQQSQQQVQSQPPAPPAPQTPARGAQASVAAPARQPRQKPCPLCGSLEHKYHAGNYGHPAGVAITKPCTQTLSDGTACGRLHAYAGPLSSSTGPCRKVGEQ